jgi:hypothetical protein
MKKLNHNKINQKIIHIEKMKLIKKIIMVIRNIKEIMMIIKKPQVLISILTLKNSIITIIIIFIEEVIMITMKIEVETEIDHMIIINNQEDINNYIMFIN